MRLPVIENKINWTTIIAVFGACITTGGMIYQGGQFTQRMDGNEKSQAAFNAKVEARLDAQDEGLKKIDNLSYRVTLSEQSVANYGQKIDEMYRLIMAQGADIRIIREKLDGDRARNAN